MFIKRRSLYVPADTADMPTGNAAELRGQLSADRDLVAVGYEHEWRQLALDAEHSIRMADVNELAARAQRARKERQRDAEEADKLAELYRTAKSSGARAKVRAAINNSVEARTMRKEKMRRAVIRIGMPVLVAFGFWSTAGVHDGFVRLLHLDGTDPLWWAAWALEPALLAIVAAIIIGRSMLKTIGGSDDAGAYLGEFSALILSIFLNMYGGWDASGWAGFGHALTHSFGPLGAAGAATLIGLYVSYVSEADPSKGASNIDDLDFGDAAFVRQQIEDGPRQLPETHLPPLPARQSDDAVPEPRSTRREAATDAPVTRRRDARRSGPVARRSKAASDAATSGDAVDADPATRGAHLVMTQGYSLRKAADAVGGTSDSSIRRRVAELRQAQQQNPGDDPANAASAEIVFTQIPDPKPSVTHGVNGHSLTPEEN